MMQSDPICIAAQTSKDTQYDRGVPVLLWQITLPIVTSCAYPKEAQRLTVWYHVRAQALQEQIHSEFLPDAIRAHRLGAAALPHEVLSVFTSTWERGCLISLYTDQYQYTGGAHGNTVRTAETWNLAWGRRLSLCELFPSHENCTKFVLQEIGRQIESEPDLYFDQAKKLAEENFDPARFYMTPNGVVVFYEAYEIAPYSSGIRTFLIPYEVDPIARFCAGNPACTA